MCPWCRDAESISVSRGGPNDGFLCTSCGASWVWDNYLKGVTRLLYPGRPGTWRPSSSVTQVQIQVRNRVVNDKAKEIYKNIMEE